MTDDKLDLDELERLAGLACEHIDDATPCLCDDCYRLWAALRNAAPGLFERVRELQGVEQDFEAAVKIAEERGDKLDQATKENATLRARIKALERERDGLLNLEVPARKATVDFDHDENEMGQATADERICDALDALDALRASEKKP